MATIDLSRYATNFAKHFDSARMQQGRVLTDDDFNEHARLGAEDMRRTRLNVIGPAGSPDDGFLIQSPQVSNGENTFLITAGSFYLGGMRLTLEADEYYHLQRDWLQQGEDASDRIATPAGGSRLDLVYLEAWQQPVSAVEDNELFEVALAGPDTATRIRIMRRVGVRQDVGTIDCDEALGGLFTAPANPGTLNDSELVTDARLKMEPDGTPGIPDLCSPPVAGGYLGAENQAIRVQLVSNTEFTWGFDNAAPLYRVQLTTDDNGVPRRIIMQTEPKDQAHWPLSGQVVELLPWSAALVNNQKLAELHGHLAKVNGGYNPDTKEFFIDIAPPAAPPGSPPRRFGEHWRDRDDASPPDPTTGDAGVLDDEGEFFYLRVWNRGSDMASPARISFVPGTAVSLAHTGLQITLTGTQFRPDDFWIIAVRPESPNVFVPWDFDPLKPSYGQPPSGRPPHGVRRWFTPLAIIQWTPGASPIGVVVHDCRQLFLPLTRMRNCCTYTVGDGITSHGHFHSIQTAVNHLPPEGGQICLLPGLYEENVRIVNRRNVTICGCGLRSLVRSRGPRTQGTAALPVISIIGGFNITLDCFAVEADATGLGILIRGNNLFSRHDQETATPVVGVLLSDLKVTAVQQSAVRARFLRDLTVRYCTLINRDQGSAGQTLVVLGDDVLIERNLIEVPAEARPEVFYRDSPEFAPGSHAQGGMQIEGLSDRVRIINNLIRGGINNGITLGSFSTQIEPPDDPPDEKPPEIDPCDPCDPIDSLPDPPPDDGGSRIVAGGPLSEIRIERNRIYQMGACGIGVARFFDLRGQDEFISVYQLTILGNHIRHCLLREIRGPKPEVSAFVGYGGISLADVHHLVVYDNVIEDCGLSLREPVCGIFVLQAEGSDLSRNRIFENGVAGLNIQRETLANTNLTLGYRGGIVIAFALAPMGGPSPETIAPAPFVAAQIKPPPTPTGEPAAKIHDNIVTVPVGRALHLNALGPVSVEGNHFTSRGVVQGFSAIFSSQLAATVWILNLGFSNEFYLGYFFFAADSNKAPLPGLDQFAIGRSLATGQVLFNDNQVTFDAFDPGVSFALSSVLIATADDLGFQDNHCESNLFNDFVVTQSLLLGVSSRTNSNRFTEGKLNAFFSAVTVGFIANTTTINQATHCILSRCILNPLGLKYALNFETVGVNPILGRDLLCARIQASFGGRDQTIEPHP